MWTRPRSGKLAAMAICCGGLIADGIAQAGDATIVAAEPKISFNESIRPLFAEHCVACHGGVKQAAGLSFIYREIATSETDSGVIPIVPGDPDDSYLIERVSDPDPDFRMPPAEHGAALSKDEIETLRRWIQQGAEWEEHWSFVLPRPQEAPPVLADEWPREIFDRFVLARLEAADMSPSPEADRATWLRRASLDLTGLPPTPEQYEEFAADRSDKAYERAVDRMLASPHFGERWAAVWLDLARFADTQGYEKDPHRDIWPYRDWLIRAFNADMPYDEFTIKQLAGDMLPDAGIEDRLATAFHRNSQTNTEGGTDDEEFRIAALLDRVSTTWQVWQATTFRCIQCHSHPYDPIRHEEYYQFAAILNTSRDADLSDDLPKLAVPRDPADWPRAAQLDRKISELRQSIFAETAPIAESESNWQTLRPGNVEATGQTELVARDNDAGVAEVWAEGTITSNGVFTLTFPLDAAVRITAIRIDALPKNVVAALKTPEMGFALTQLEASLLPDEKAESRPIQFAEAFGDQPEPMFDPRESLEANNNGWSDLTKLFRPRYAVFVPTAPIEAPAGSRLQLKLHFGRTATGDIPLVIHRGRYSVATTEAWTDLVQSDRLAAQREKMAAIGSEREKIPATPTPVMDEQYGPVKRETYLFSRGNWLEKAQRVEPGLPAVFPPLPEGETADRLGMARWLVSGDNPLTARVMVNRLWQEMFGLGIVETAGDFGTSGARPTHPELLDYLALRFQNEHQWSVKRLLRELALSATYRQASHASPEMLERDPRNRLLSRGPRNRLTAEMIRDQALVLSKQWTPTMFGPPVMPPQPEGIWRSVYSGATWETAEGPDRFRRAVYTYWKRTSGYPTFATFDMPSREVCVAQRTPTNTPLQALATLNDEAFVELAGQFGKRMLREGGSSSESQVASGYRWATGREVPRAKLDRLMLLHRKAIEAFDSNAEEAKKLADSRDAFALSVVASALLNLDEVLTK